MINTASATHQRESARLARHPRAVIAQSFQMPEVLMLGVRGSGVSLCAGFAPMGWVAASEPPGVTGEAGQFLRVTTPGEAQGARNGSALSLDRELADDLAGVRRYHLDGTAHPVRPREIETGTEH